MFRLVAFGPMLLIGGALLATLAFRKRGEHKRYEFEHRSSGGVVEFQSYEHSKAFQRSVMFWDLVKVAGMMIAFAGVVLLRGC